MKNFKIKYAVQTSSRYGKEEKNNMTLKERAYKIDTFATYLEGCGIVKDEEIKSAARYQLNCIRMGDENGRWCNASDKDKRLLREFVRKYC